MGIMMEQAGLMERLFNAVQMMMSRTRGVLFVSMIFAAATGIVGASVTILGIMAAKTMNRSGYDVRLYAGGITAGGTLGILVPPSVMLIVMGPVLEPEDEQPETSSFYPLEVIYGDSADWFALDCLYTANRAVATKLYLWRWLAKLTKKNTITGINARFLSLKQA